MSEALQQVLVAFFATLVFLKLLSAFAPKVGLVDAPNHRKQHEGHIPLVGGVAIFASLFVSTLYWEADSMFKEAHGNTVLSDIWIFMLAGGILVALGVVDDRFSVSVGARMGVEIAVALVLIEGLDLKTRDLGDLFGMGPIVLPEWMIYPFLVVSIFGVINAFNMLDGIDGLLAMLVLITMFAFHLFTGVEPGIVTMTLSASLCAFLVSNLGLSPAIPKTFLGDAGSKFLGFVVVSLILSVTAQQVGNAKLIEPVTALFLVGLPLFDMVYTTLSRLSQGKSPFSADRGHIHHLMQALGISQKRTLMLISCLAFAPPLLGLALHSAKAPDHIQFFVFIGMFGLYCIVTSQAWRVANAMNSLREQRYEVELTANIVQFPDQKDDASVQS